MPGGSSSCRRAAEPRRRLVELGAQIAGFVDLIEQIGGDHPVRLVWQIGADLLHQMLAQGARSRRGLVETGKIVAVDAAAADAPRRVAAEIDRAVAVAAARGIPLFRAVGGKLARRRLERRGGFGLQRGADRLGRGNTVFAAALGALQQRVLFDLGIDIVGELKVRQLQHLDRLLQLRRHHQSLGLAKRQRLRKTDPVQADAPFGAGL
jgi:hypothetical protein